jgi:bla regulator protein BlaR1
LAISGAAVLGSLPAIWLIGVVAVLVRWGVRWRRVVALVRAGAPADGGSVLDTLRRLEAMAGTMRPLTVVLSDGSLEAGVFGILKPVLVWPQRIAAHLAATHIEAILAYELAHVRRRDNLAAAAHMLVQATSRP